jgi:hypothetical protein
MPMFLIGGLDPNSPAMRHYKLVEGRYMQRPNEIVIGQIAADTYKVGVGDTLDLNGNRYRIVGITATGVAYEDGGGMLALSEAQRLMGTPARGELHLRRCQRPGASGASRGDDQRPLPRGARQHQQRICPEHQ